MFWMLQICGYTELDASTPSSYIHFLSETEHKHLEVVMDRQVEQIQQNKHTFSIDLEVRKW